MDQKERLKRMKAALVDFVLQASKILHLERIIAFGSLLEEDVSKKSDIDLLLVFSCQDHDPEKGKEMDIVTKTAAEITDSYDLENPIRAIAVSPYNLKDFDEEFLKKVSREGFLVWHKGNFTPFAKHPEIKPKVLFCYKTTSLSLNTKRSFLRRIKRLTEKFGQKLSPGAVLIEQKNTPVVEKVLKESKVKFQKYQIFL